MASLWWHHTLCDKMGYYAREFTHWRDPKWRDRHHRATVRFEGRRFQDILDRLRDRLLTQSADRSLIDFGRELGTSMSELTAEETLRLRQTIDREVERMGFEREIGRPIILGRIE